MDDGFKDTEIGSIPDDWDIKPFEECINKEKISKDIKIPQGQYKPTGKYPIVDQGAEFIAGYTDDKDKLYSGNLPVIVFGDHTRIFKFVDFSFTLGADGTKLILSKNFLNPRYLYFYLCGLNIESRGYNRHYKYLKEKTVVFPSDGAEQQNIVVILSEIQKAIAQQEQIIAKTKELKRSLMHRLFTHGLRGEELKETEIGRMPTSWNAKRLGDVVEKTYQKDMTRAPNVQFKYIDVSSVSNESLKITEYKTYKGSEAPSRARKIVKVDDVLFATVRPTLRRIAFVGNEYDEEICSTAFCVLRSKAELTSRYLYFCVQRDEFVENLGKLQRGVSYPAVTDGNVKDQLIPFPEDISEQDEIADILWHINEKIEHELYKQESLKELFKTMLQLLMTGQVRVKDIDFGEIYPVREA